jgi:uncharacterized protein YciI
VTTADGATDESGTFVFRLIAPRPTFALDMSDEEREIMGRHAAHWQPLLDAGKMVFFGPVLDETGSWGLGIVEAESEQELRAFAASDPVVTSGTGRIDLGRMLGGFVRPRDGHPPASTPPGSLEARDGTAAALADRARPFPT